MINKTKKNLSTYVLLAGMFLSSQASAKISMDKFNASENINPGVLANHQNYEHLTPSESAANAMHGIVGSTFDVGTSLVSSADKSIATTISQNTNFANAVDEASRGAANFTDEVAKDSRAVFNAHAVTNHAASVTLRWNKVLKDKRFGRRGNLKHEQHQTIVAMLRAHNNANPILKRAQASAESFSQ